MKPESKLAARPYFSDVEQILVDIRQILERGKLILGPYTSQFENALAKYVGVKHAVALSSCTAALTIALQTVIKSDGEFDGESDGESGEVILPSNTFVATANAIRLSGGKPIFAEIKEDLCLDVDHVLELITNNTKAIIIVHIAGFISGDIEKLLRECQQRNIMLVEDCAHAMGSSYRGVKAGALGQVGCFSFYPTKILSCGVGGALTTNSDVIADYARSVRHHGQGSCLEDITNFGNDFLMDEMRAAIAYYQLQHLEKTLSYRRTIAVCYDNLLSDTRIVPCKPTEQCNPSYYKYPVLLPETVDRDQVRRKLFKRGIETGAVYWPPVHLQPVYKNLQISLPRTEAILRRQLCLPMHSMVGVEDCQEIVEMLKTTIL